MLTDLENNPKSIDENEQERTELVVLVLVEVRKKSPKGLNYSTDMTNHVSYLPSVLFLVYYIYHRANVKYPTYNKICFEIFQSTLFCYI